ncbi:hypothetical protein BC936DRAFT_143511 [Jimgerdemannia flammicorona]|uniref:Fucosyltransferase n=1 Tax=Jimgerdemannia flammicorona TaxID=994334 RepID=A0A433DDU7_9FUNG|nr:hypothetical protein BC936DRAFT_143511 [Jimgerdemannia flammicorona]
MVACIQSLLKPAMTTLILYWTPYHKNASYWDGHIIDQCGLSYTCQLTHHRERLNDASIVVFHAPEIRLGDLPATGSRPWVLHLDEPPIELKWMRKKDDLERFQYSMSYRLDSAFPSLPFSSTFFADSLKPLVVPWSQRNPVPVAWIDGDCTASNGRHYYVRELMRWIDVDVYGGCLTNKEWPKDMTPETLLSTYKFHLTLEPANCVNYLSPNTYFATALRVGSVPVVDGPHDYDPFSPHKDALVELDDFASPRDLATYLSKAARNETLYATHFHYKQTRPELSRKFVAFWDRAGHAAGPTGWGYDTESAWCRACRLATEPEHETTTQDHHIAIERMCILRKHLKWRTGFVGIGDYGMDVGVPGQWGLVVVTAAVVAVMVKKNWRKWIDDYIDFVTGYEGDPVGPKVVRQKIRVD